MRRGHRSHGSVLIVVLWASFGLVATTLLFGHSMIMTYRGADNDLAGRQAEQAIEGGIRYVEALLADQTTPGVMLDPLTMTSEAAKVGEATFYLLRRAEDDATGQTREYGIVDEGSKMNLNTAPVPLLLLLPRMTDELAAAIDDWRTPPTGGGGTPSTTVKDAKFESVEELALVSGMTREILYGEDTNLNGVLDPSEDDGDKTPPTDNGDGRLDPGLYEYLTVATTEPINDPAGTARVSVTGPRAALDALILATFPARGSQMVATLTNPVTSVIDMMAKCAMTPDEAELIVDKVRNPSSEGLINLNTASEALLTLLFDADTASQLIAARLARTLPTRDLTWAASIIQPFIATRGPLLTGSTYQVSVDAAAVGRNGRGYRRSRVVIDMNAYPPPVLGQTPPTAALTVPRIIYRRNLAPLGWALGREVRQELALQREF